MGLLDKAAQRDSNSSAAETQEEYVRVRSAPPQAVSSEEEGEQVFQLCNMDGTPLVFDLGEENEQAERKSKDEESMEEELRKVMIGVKEVSITDNKSIPEERKPDEHTERFEDVYEQKCVPQHIRSVFFESEDRCKEISEFEKFLQIEDLISQYPGVNLEYIKARISELLSETRRKEIPIEFICPKGGSTVMDKLKSLKEKEDTVLQKIRNEFNRVTVENVNEVVDNLKAIRVKKVSEMQEVAGFVLEKAITETVYLNTYSFIIGRLKKEWKCDEEMSMTDRKQTCFFGTLLKFLLARINTKHTWAQEIDVNTINVPDRAKLEEVIEEYESSRLKRKNMAIGSIDLLTTLYLQNTIGPSTLVTVCEYFSSSDNAESVELISRLLKAVCEKFAENGKLDIVTSTYNYLAKNMKKHGLRVEYLVELTMKYVATNVPAVRTKTTSSGNAFSSLAEGSSSSEEVDESQHIQEFIYEVSSRVQKIDSDNDREELYKDVVDFIKKHPDDNRLFFTSYVIELVSNGKSKDSLIDFFVSKLYFHASDFLGSINDVKAEYAMLKIDFPRSPRYFSEFISILRAADMLSQEDFERLKPQNFAQLASELIKRWQVLGDERLKKVFTPEERKMLSQ